MNNRYKIILTNNNIYKEIELTPDAQQVKVGTGVDCDVRLRKELFFEQIELLFVRKEDEWSVICSDNLYLTIGDVRKLLTKDLKHGDTFEVKYQASGNEIFNFEFMLDFDYKQKEYNRTINISNINQIQIGGGTNCEIKINDQFVGADSLTLQRNGEGFNILDNNSRYGIYVNGSRINKKRKLNEYDFFSIAGYSFYFKDGVLYTTNTNKILINSLESVVLDECNTCFKYPKFNRSTRIQYIIPEDEIEIQQPQPKPQKPKKNIVLSLVPALSMLGLMVVLRGIMGNGGTFVIYSVCSMSIGVIMSVISFILDGKTYKKEVAKREADYNQYIEEKKMLIQAARDNELRIRNLIYESLERSINEVETYGKRIFEKGVSDKDFLDVYIGKGTVEANCKVTFTKQEFVDIDDPLSTLPEKVENEFRNIENAPIISRLNSSCGVGIIGNKNDLNSVIKNMTLDIAIRHFYKEVKLYYMFTKEDAKQFQWVKWLQHVKNDDIGIRNIMCDDESRNILLESLYSELSRRETMKKEQEGIFFNDFVVVFVADSFELLKHPVSKYLENCNDYGFTFIFFEGYEESLPMGCTEIIRLNSAANNNTILLSENGDFQSKFSYQLVSDETAEQVALKLGSMQINEVSLESELTKSITMFELLNIMSIDDLNLKKRWTESKVYESMAAPLGVKSKNELVSLDISDKASAHGPHGLVAGTTGSGKSEILQSYVLSMASLFHPYDVGFVIIDFKGGGMVNQFNDLPHMLGAITNIDGREINRSLLSIKAELIKRQSLFSKSGVNHINDYIKLYKKGEVNEPLPHLIMVVDEFAELKAEFPDFMKEIISAARIGRTLGVHLILATQKPAGVVDNQIWSNSKFKLCLKVQTKEDSNEVIKSPLAAEIVEPGRAYFQVGNNEIFELFQSAYSGAKVLPDGETNANLFDLYSLNTWGKKSLIYSNKKKRSSDDAKNQLQIMVEYIKMYCAGNSIKQLNGICLPSLEDLIYKESLYKVEKNIENGIQIAMGIYDDPEQQKQENYILNLSESNTYIIGSAQTGKTTFLQTMLLQLFSTYSPAEVNVYIIDCGNMALKMFANSNHVGGVVLPAEEERVINLFKMLFNIIEQRKNKFVEKGLGTYKAYIEAGFADLPQIVLVIDNIAAFREYHDGFDDDILSLSREGNSVGISIVATASQTNAMNYKALSNYGTRIAFSCNDIGEYMNLFDRCRIEPKDTAGRGLCSIDKRIVEFQTVLCARGEKEIERVEHMKEQIEVFNQNNVDLFAKPIPEVPAIVSRKVLINKNSELFTKPYYQPIGIDYSTVEYKMINLLTIGMLSVLGREKSGKTNFIKNIMDCINDKIFDNLTEAYVLDNSNMQLDFTKKYGFVSKYTTDVNDCEEIIGRIFDELSDRNQLVIDNRNRTSEDVLKEKPLLLLVVDNSGFIELMAQDKELYGKFVAITKQYKKLKVFTVFANIDNVATAYGSPEILKQIKESKQFIVFEDLANLKFVDTTVKQQKEYPKPISIGDAYYFNNGELSKIKTIYDDKE